MTEKAISAIVIDDDFNTVEIFSDILQLKGINVIGKGYDGSEAVMLFENLRPDVVFLDVMMVNVDGISALEQIRKLDPIAIVIMITADLRKETEEKINQFNASAIIYKPFDINQLIKIVQELTTKRTASDLVISSKDQ